jgi:cytochrome c oxidase cbb3-type subunit 3
MKSVVFGGILAGAAAFLLFQPTMANAANANGAKIFQDNCAVCHGDHGEGTSMGKGLGAPDLGSKAVQSKSDAFLKNIIENGKGGMPAWKSMLKPAEIDAVLKHVRTFGHK